MKWVQPWLRRMIACRRTSRGPAIRIASGQEAQDHRAGLIRGVDQGAVAADARVVVDVAGLGDADDRVDQEPAADLLGRALGQLFVGAVQRVAGLEGDHLRPAERLEVLAKLGGGPPQLGEIVVGRGPQHLEPAGRVMARLAVEIGDRGMLGVGRAVGAPGLGLLVELVDLLDVQEGEEVAVDVAERQRLPLGDAVAGGHRQRDRQGPERAVGQPHLGDDPSIVGLAHEALQGGEPADGQQLQVAEPALVEREARHILGRRLHLGGPCLIHHQVHQRPTIRGVQAALFLRDRSGTHQAPSKK